VLRAKVDMQHENMQMRDPVMYRIRFSHHHNTGDEWCIYPTYDWAHGQSDAIEGVTHSICTLEFDSHRALYDWYLEHCPLPGDQPKQIEFARLEFTHTVTSKRKLMKLVTDGVVSGWDDPRMPTLQGLRRRGYPAAAIRDFCRDIGTTKTNSRQSIEALESYVRRELNRTSQRRMAVLNPLKLVITNWPDRRARRAGGRPLRHRQQPRERGRRHPLGGVHGRAVDRGGGLRRGAAAEVLPAEPRQGGSAPRCLPRHGHRRRQGRAG
jgi:glutaminyl-tRNA synthetase